MANYSYEELERIANAIRNAWAAGYGGGSLPGANPLKNTGAASYNALQGNVIEVVGGGIFSGMPLKAIIAMNQSGHEEAIRIQDGYGPFDMKPGFLKSPKARTNKEGKKYFIMSFRHMTPKTSGIIGKRITPSIHKEAKAGGKFMEQAGTKEDPSDYGLANSKGYEWQNGPYTGMKNIRDEGGKHSQLRTFRIISENSDPNSWWHPGVKPNDIMGATVDYVTPYVAEGIKRAAKIEVVEEINKIFNQKV